MFFKLVVSCLAFLIPSSTIILVQPGCSPSDHVETFYNIYSNSSIDLLHNWVCREDFQQKLKICSAMYMAINRRPFTTTHEVVRDNATVSRECQRRNVTFGIYEDPLPTYDDQLLDLLSYDESYEANASREGKEADVSWEKKQADVTVDVNMFKCPITKMNIRFLRSWTPIDIFDLYIVTGTNDVNVIVLRDSMMPGTENICVIDMFYYSGNEDIKCKGMYNKP